MTSAALADAIDQFTGVRGYLAAASIGLPPKKAVAAMRADLNAWEAADRDPMGYDITVDNSRAHYARLVNVSASSVAYATQTSTIASVIAASAPDGAEVVCVDGDFTSIVFPFAVRGRKVRSVPLEALAESLTDETWLVAFSLVQSSNGKVADVAAVLEAAAAHDVLTFCDSTQGAGVTPFDASQYDITACHAYKWLCSPRGVAFMTVNERAGSLLTPIHAGWYAGGDGRWTNIYGPEMKLATDARRFDVSPAWQATIGAEQALDLFAGLDIPEIWERTTTLGDALCDGLGIPQQHQAIVTWPDESGGDVKKLIDNGIKVSGRAGRLRAAFHLWNDESDVDAVLKTLR
ncbi:MAG: aminotransferase class V-fold PLP-dependent enzyme [Pseudolysinimonas sp.]